MSLTTSARPPSTAPLLAPAADDHSPDRLQEVRVQLEEHRSARLDQIKALAFTDPADGDLDPAARTRLLAVAKLTLAEIDLALRRLGDGSYGYCVGCTDPVPAERLQAVPYARYCMPCASRA